MNRPGKACGKSHISASKKCMKQKVARRAAAVGAVGLGVGIAALASRRSPGRLNRPGSGGGGGGGVTPRPRGPAPTPPGGAIIPVKVRPISPPRPIGVLPASRIGTRRMGKTARMRMNTSQALASARREVGQTARLEVQRLGRLGNTAAATGEAAGMAAKTTFREFRLRAEKLRRRWEPGYRKNPSRVAPPAQRRLAPGSDRPLGEINLKPLAQQPGGARLEVGRFQLNRPLQRRNLQGRRGDAGEQRLGKPCGKSHIAKQKKCSKPPTARQIAVGAAKGAIVAGAAAGAVYAIKGFSMKRPTMDELIKKKGPAGEDWDQVINDSLKAKNRDPVQERRVKTIARINSTGSCGRS